MTNVQRDWGSFALLVIDVQKDFWSERTAQSFPHFPTNIARLLTLCRAEGIEIVHLRASFKPDMSDWMPMYKLRGRIPCVQGTVGVETLPFALDNPGETVIIKQTFDGFHNPALLQYLRSCKKITSRFARWLRQQARLEGGNYILTRPKAKREAIHPDGRVGHFCLCAIDHCLGYPMWLSDRHC